MSASIIESRTSHDILEPGQVDWRSHPDHLAAIAQLFGMHPQPIDRCRVLQLGCGRGRNLLAMAQRHGESRFVGVASAGTPVDAARDLAARAGIENIEFHELAESEIDERLGSFDYIICHDVLSRLPHAEQLALLEICRDRLNPHGVVYLSYRSRPGSIVPGIVARLAKERHEPSPSMAERVRHARKVLKVVFDSVPAESSGYLRMVRHEAELALSLDDAALVAEYLAGEHHPLLFHEFAMLVASAELQYLGDADIHTMFASSLGSEAEQRLLQFAADAIAIEQRMDLVRNRSLHRSLVVHRHVARASQWNADRLKDRFLSGYFQPEQESTGGMHADAARFKTADGHWISTPVRATRAALSELGARWPRAIGLDELLRAVEDRLGEAGLASPLGDDQRDELLKNLVECVAHGWIRPHSEADRFVHDASERPRAAPWTRIEAELSQVVTNQRHEPVELDEMSRSVLQYLDGQRDRAALRAIVDEANMQGKLSILHGGVPASQREATREILDQVLEQCLARLAHRALLTG